MSLVSEQALLGEVEAKQALHLLNSLFCRAHDRADRGLMMSLFTADASIDCGSFQGSAEPYIVSVTELSDEIERTFSSVSNEIFYITGDEARGEVCLINFTTVVNDGVKTDRLTGGRYLDKYRKVGGAWKIEHRSFVHDWNMNQPTTAVWDEGLFGLFKLRGTRDRSDPVYGMLEAL
ncbi:nuclear transport factor 2 family protein [Halopseudomonas sp. SMJS2]|uniref:nuclear transport factor 2 family protein n=1 Tax=Halopseudomonas sp. SMJS2 TaxID=3041098 RepID=UPI0024528900|nr:nuclear transport factor 2 family protein [Halopseudomonas sp. SMJS2]WGK62450.1 nuclear transport factor 2 family protein [Halopseudomonas sp. SMJS2]